MTLKLNRRLELSARTARRSRNPTAPPARHQRAGDAAPGDSMWVRNQRALRTAPKASVSLSPSNELMRNLRDDFVFTEAPHSDDEFVTATPTFPAAQTVQSSNRPETRRH